VVAPAVPRRAAQGLARVIEGVLESLDGAGVFTGWLRNTDDPAPVAVEIRLQGQAVAQAVASAFRPDLLRSGHGHGHYGFHARLLAALPPGQAAFELFLPRTAQGVRTGLAVPRIALAGAVAVETLLRPEPGWTVDDLLPALPCLDLDTQLTALGMARYIDAAYRFVLERWPVPGESQAYTLALTSGGATADDVVRDLLQSRERQDMGPNLMSPWDPGFPFGAAHG
jgi:hypothetical protein